MLNQMYEDYCANRLPCGICRLTNAICPKTPINTKITDKPKTPWEDPRIDIYYNTDSSAKVTTTSEVTATC